MQLLKSSALAFSLTLVAGTVIAQTYTESPATGSFEGADHVSNDPPKAGEFTIEAEGVLPPTEERLVITSGGTKGNKYYLNNCVDIEYYHDEGVADGYCEFDRGAGGTYLYNVNYSMTVEAETVDTLYTCGKGSSEITAMPYVDDGPPGYNSYYYPHEDDSNLDTDEEDVDKNDETNERVVGEKKHLEGNESKVADAEQEVYNDHGDTSCQAQGSPTYHEKTVDFSSNGSVSLGYQEQGHEYAQAEERFYMFFKEFSYIREVTSIVPSYNLKDGYLQYITPAGNSYLNIDGSIFTPVEYTNNNEVSETVSSGTSGWQNTSKTVEASFPEMPDRPAGGTGKVVVEGEYYAGSPPGVSPEAYRWIHISSGKVLDNYTNLDSSDVGYRTLRTEFDNRDRDMPSGTYRLQIKSKADNYPVEFRQRDFKIKRDGYVSYQGSRTFNPEFELGYNEVSVYTRGTNNIRYRVEWTECHNPVGAISPGNESMVDQVDPTLELTNNCNSIDKISFRDARTDAVIKQFEDVSNGERLTAETDLNIGDTYRWYVRFCDQDMCYSTDTYEFTIGQRDPESGQVTVEESTSQGLEYVVRDEDFNPYGQPNKSNETLADNLPGDKKLGYINKLEEESDQLEPGMATTSFNMNDPDSENTVSIWSNSQGGNDTADQWGIAPYPNWSISNRGNPYPPWGTYYRDTDTRRASTNSPTVQKTSKAFGNSLAVVAQEDVTNSGGDLVAREGAGVWIDPDNIDWTRSGAKYEYTRGDWEDLLEFNMDLTGPDSGIGYDAGDGAAFQPLGDEDDPSRKSVIKADIYFKGENN